MTETTQHREQVVIGAMERHELPVVVNLLARALRDNPMNMGMFGPPPDRRLQSVRTLYRLLLSGQPEPPLVARLSDAIVGAAAVSPPATCYFRRSRARQYRISIAGRGLTVAAPAAPWRELLGVLRLGVPALNRAALMARASDVHDPADRHWHVELVGVEPKLQRQGIGGKLMEAVLLRSDGAGEPAYLEADTTQNVEFYRRRGFEVTATEELLGVQVWYMQRSAALGR